MIFHEHNAILFHPGKTAGTAVEQMIRPGKRDPKVANHRDMYGLDRDLNIYLHHATCRTTLDIVGEEVFWSYFKFTIVRNPYTRLLSAFYYLIDQNQRLHGTFRDFVLKLPDLIAAPFRQLGSHPISQRHYTHLDDQQVVDHIGRFEEIEDTVAHVNRQLGLEASLPKVNVDRRPQYLGIDKRRAYDAEMVDVMRRVYRDDFELYGYSPDPPA